MPRLTDEQYVQVCGGVCPYCQSDQIQGEHVEVDGSQAWQEIECLHCEGTWLDIYTLSGYETKDIPENILAKEPML